MAESSSQAIVWKPDFATGVAIIDDQHRVLIGMINDANTKLDDHSPTEDYARIVQGLLNYAGYHFQTEERLIVEHGYDRARTAEAERHIQQHKAFADRVIALQQGLQAERRIAKADLVKFLTDWLADHILHIDKDLGAHIRDSQQRAGKT